MQETPFDRHEPVTAQFEETEPRMPSEGANRQAHPMPEPGAVTGELREGLSIRMQLQASERGERGRRELPLIEPWTAGAWWTVSTNQTSFQRF